MLAALLGLVAVVWTVQNEIVHASVLVGNAVPAITALALLLILSGFRAARRNGLALRVYLTVAIASAIAGIASMSYLFAPITVPQYLGDPRLVAHFAKGYAPPAGEAIRAYFEGNRTGAIPWDAWTAPLALWGSFLILLLLTIHALLALLRASWMDHERLSYPMVQIALRVAGDETPALWRCKGFWVGFALTAAFDAINMLHAFFPQLPEAGTSYNLGALLTERPWTALAPMLVSFRPEILGIAYLMPTEVLLTAWTGYLALRLSSVARVAWGEDLTSGSYDYQELGVGAFLCLFVLLLVRAAPALRASFRAAWSNPPAAGAERGAWATLLGGLALLVAWLVWAGLPLWLAAAHLAVIVAVAVVYARMRAETGAPMVYLFPFGQQQALFHNLFGSQLLTGTDPRTLTVLTSLAGLSRGYFPEVSAYGAEGMHLARRAGFAPRAVTRAVVLGVVLGVVAGGLLHLHAMYQHGAVLLGRSPFSEMTSRYNAVLPMLSTPTPPKPPLVFQTVLGAATVLALSGLRSRFVWFPLHPMGFAMASAYGFHLWGPFLLAWACKILVLRFGGLRLYRRGVPLFLGIALGRYLFSGIVWGALGFFGHPATESFQLQFG